MPVCVLVNVAAERNDCMRGVGIPTEFFRPAGLASPQDKGNGVVSCFGLRVVILARLNEVSLDYLGRREYFTFFFDCPYT